MTSLLLAGCAPLKVSDPQSLVVAPLHGNNPILRVINEAKPPCLGMVRTFCENLYSPDHRGSLSLPGSGGSLEIRKGNTDNDFSQIYFEYAATQIRFQERLPADFRSLLRRFGYFHKLRTYLARKPRRTMTVEERARVVRLAHDIEALWDSAVSETALKRMEANHPGYSQLQEDLIPWELKRESSRVRSILTSEIARAVWTEHPKWQQVEKEFEAIRQAFLEVVSQSAALPSEVKINWTKRIRDSKLIVPGSDPEVDALACARTEQNAYYYTERNYLTVCAGDFNSEDVRHTLAHELAHSLDISRSITLFESQSALGQSLTDLRRASCSSSAFSCPRWREFKDGFEQSSRALYDFKPVLPRFHKCLQSADTVPFPAGYLERIAREDAQSTISRLAEDNAFLRIISSHLPAPNGKRMSNPMQLNPCEYFLWDSSINVFDGELAALLFFTSEYRCSEEASPVRFKSAMDQALTLLSSLIEARMRAEGEFSSRVRLSADGHAASPNERFADALGALTFAHLLKKERDVTLRRAVFLANNAWLCARPSLRQILPLEAGIQRKYYVESHSEETQRQKEVLSSEIREVLECEKDFEMDECRL